jgi:hypothetical protein
MRKILYKENFSEDDRQSWVADLEIAIACDPGWQEPAELLESIRAV